MVDTFKKYSENLFIMEIQKNLCVFHFQIDSIQQTPRRRNFLRIFHIFCSYRTQRFVTVFTKASHQKGLYESNVVDLYLRGTRFISVQTPPELFQCIPSAPAPNFRDSIVT
jgi:hypothetical protein